MHHFDSHEFLHLFRQIQQVIVFLFIFLDRLHTIYLNNTLRSCNFMFTQTDPEADPFRLTKKSTYKPWCYQGYLGRFVFLSIFNVVLTKLFQFIR